MSPGRSQPSDCGYPIMRRATLFPYPRRRHHHQTILITPYQPAFRTNAAKQDQRSELEFPNKSLLESRGSFVHIIFASTHLFIQYSRCIVSLPFLRPILNLFNISDRPIQPLTLGLYTYIYIYIYTRAFIYILTQFSTFSAVKDLSNFSLLTILSAPFHKSRVGWPLKGRAHFLRNKLNKHVI